MCAPPRARFYKNTLRLSLSLFEKNPPAKKVEDALSLSLRLGGLLLVEAALKASREKWRHERERFEEERKGGQEVTI